MNGECCVLIAAKIADSPGQQRVNSTFGNGVVTDFTLRADGLISSIATTKAGSQSVGTYRYSIAGVTNAAGQVVERYAYTARGETIVLSISGTENDSSQDFVLRPSKKHGQQTGPRRSVF